MSRFVRQSAYRHTFGTPAKRELQHENIKVSMSAFDTNLVSASAKYLSVNWAASGGGAFLVTPLDIPGKLPDLFPLCRAHTAPVLDTHWSPFDDSLVASVGEDSKLALTRVDDQILRDAWSGEREVPDLQPLYTKPAHGRKAGHVRWHPTAKGILATASNDVKVWDVEAQTSVLTGDAHGDIVQSLDWSWTGDVYVTTCKDKKLRLFDPRTGSAAVTVADSHSGVKGSRVAWLGSLDRIVTTGFSRTSDRQMFLWDARELAKGPIKQQNIDQSSGMLMPFFTAANNVLFLAGKGDGNIRMYELENDELFYLSDYTSPQPQRGMCFAPPRAVDVSGNEIAKAYKAVGTTIEPISFVVPRKSDSFQADLFPPVPSDEPALSAADWFGGKSSAPILVNQETRQHTASSAAPAPTYKSSAPAASTPASPPPAPEPIKAATPPAAATPAREPSPPPAPKPAPAPAPEPVSSPAPAIPTPAPAVNGSASNDSDNGEATAALKEEVKELKARLAEKDAHIRELELKLERVKSAIA